MRFYLIEVQKFRYKFTVEDVLLHNLRLLFIQEFECLKYCNWMFCYKIFQDTNVSNQLPLGFSEIR